MSYNQLYDDPNNLEIQVSKNLKCNKLRCNDLEVNGVSLTPVGYTTLNTSLNYSDQNFLYTFYYKVVGNIAYLYFPFSNFDVSTALAADHFTGFSQLPAAIRPSNPTSVVISFHDNSFIDSIAAFSIETNGNYNITSIKTSTGNFPNAGSLTGFGNTIISDMGAVAIYPL